MSARRKGYQQVTGRPMTMGTNGMVASPHYLASAAGASVLHMGGSAVDACIATNAVLSVVLGHMSGLGGDLFAQIWDNGKLEAINGSGRAGSKVTIDFYKSKGWDDIEPRGPLAANTVPGVVDAWSEMHRRFGRTDWEQLLRPAIGYAEDGFPITQKFCNFISEHSDTLRRFEGTSRVFLRDDKPPSAGTRVRQPDLAKSLRLLADKGADTFYRGELGSRIVGGLRQAGGLLTEDDFASHTSDWVEPLRTTYRGFEVTEMPPNTQGIATLMILNMLEHVDMHEIGEGTADYYHLMTETIKLAFADRDYWVTDPKSVDIPYDRLLSKDYAKERLNKVHMARSRGADEIEAGIQLTSARRGMGGDTVYMCAVDRDGQACSLIQSVYFEFGSAFMPEGTGILLQNRGSFFELDPDHPNALEPGKRTFHTIIPAMALRDGKPALLFGTMGGEGQPQTQAAMLTRMVDFGFDVQEAIEAPRWLYGRTWGEESKSLKLEGRISDTIADDLTRRGHDVEMLEDWSQTLGHAQAIRIDREEGTLHGGADPRGDGAAIGF